MLSCSFSKDMDDNVETIHEYPLSVVVPFHVGWSHSFGFEAEIDRIGDGFDLSVALTRCYDKKICKCSSIAKVKYD